MHKLFRVNEKVIAKRYDKLTAVLNIPSMAAAFTLVIIANVIIRFIDTPMELYRAVLYSTNVFAAYSFAVCGLSSVISTHKIAAHKKYTYIEIFSNAIVFSQHEKTVRNGRGEPEEYIRLWVMSLSDVEDVYADRGCLFIKGKARYFCMPEEWLRYTAAENGRVSFERWWNDDYGGRTVSLVKLKDYYLLGERILKRILLCAERYRTDERKKREFRERMLSIARKIDHKRGIAPKYKDPPARVPRGGYKDRKFW